MCSRRYASRSRSGGQLFGDHRLQDRAGLLGRRRKAVLLVGQPVPLGQVLDVEQQVERRDVGHRVADQVEHPRVPGVGAEADHLQLGAVAGQADRLVALDLAPVPLDLQRRAERLPAPDHPAASRGASAHSRGGRRRGRPRASSAGGRPSLHRGGASPRRPRGPAWSGRSWRRRGRVRPGARRGCTRRRGAARRGPGAGSSRPSRRRAGGRPRGPRRAGSAIRRRGRASAR